MRASVRHGFTISGGNNGVIVRSNSSVSFQGTTITGNASTGLQLLGNSSATISQFSSTNNGLFGIDVEASSSLIVTGSNSVQGNGVFGIQVNNSPKSTCNASYPGVAGISFSYKLTGAKFERR